MVTAVFNFAFFFLSLMQTQIEPKTGPLSGGILLTIMGSNLGIKAEDVKNITVADKECVFKEEFYSVSTR